MTILHRDAALASSHVAVASNVNAAVAATKGLRLMGYTLHEASGGPAPVEMHLVNGATVAGGTPVSVAKVPVDGSDKAWFGPNGVDCRNGISIEAVAGSMDIVIYYKTEE